jgi:ubiquitin C-terminal hydrolase
MLAHFVELIDGCCLSPGDKAYLVSQRFVDLLRSEPQGCKKLSNSDLLLNGRIKPDIQLGRDYVLVTRDVWTILSGAFTASPEFSCTVLPDGSPELSLLQLSVRFGQRTRDLKVSRSMRRSELSQLIRTEFGLGEGFLVCPRNLTAQVRVADPIGRSLDSDTRLDIVFRSTAAPVVRVVPGPPVPAIQLASGLKNLGNTCFMNASLQALLSFDSLLNSVETRLGGADFLRSTRLTGVFLNLCLAVKQSRTVVDPTEFKRCIGELVPFLKGRRQEDAHEFTTFLLDKLKDECDFFRTLFFGRLQNETICGLCHEASTADELFSSISLPLAESRRLVWSPYDLTRPLQRVCSLPRVPAILVGRDVNGRNRVTAEVLPEFVTIFVLERPDLEPGFGYAMLRLQNEAKTPCSIPILIRVPLAVELGDDEFEQIFRERLLPITEGCPIVFHKRPSMFTLNDDGVVCNEFIEIAVHNQVSDIRLKMTLSSALPVTELIERYFREMALDIDNKSLCGACGGESCALRRVTLVEAPENLVLQLKRFKVRGKEFRRDDSDVVVPPLLDLTPFFIQMQHQPVTYQQIAVVNHFGSLVSGHYTAYGMRAGKWLYFDDSVVTVRDPPVGGSQSPYLLYYARLRRPIS